MFVFTLLNQRTYFSLKVLRLYCWLECKIKSKREYK